MLARNDVSQGLSAALLRTLLESTTDCIVVFDPDGCIQLINAGSEKLFGYSGPEIIGRNFDVLVPMPRHNAHCGHELFAGTQREVIAKHKDQSAFPLCLSVNKGRTDEKSIFVGVMNNLTDHNLDQTVRKSEQRLEAMLNGVSDAIITVNEDGMVESFSNAASQMFGYSRREVIGHPVTMLMPSPYSDEPGKNLARFRSKDRAALPAGARIVIGQKADGSAFPMEISLGETLDGEQRVITVFIRDMTGRVGTEQRLEQLQSELLRVSRLDAMGQMTLAIAHELNQPLAAITNYVNTAKQGLSSATMTPALISTANEMIDMAAAQALRAASIIKSLRDFVEKREVKRELANLGQVIEEAVALAFVCEAAKGVKVKIILDHFSDTALIDRIQIQQVLFNLIRNSLEAMQKSEKRLLTLSTRSASDGFAEVSVQDTGPGIPEDIAKRLFLPFVTSKSNGMGVGLTICQAIINAHGGRIWLEQNDADGTIFRFRLPTHDTGAQQ